MFPRVWPGFARILSLTILCFPGGDAGLPEQRTLPDSSGLPESLSLSGSSPFHTVNINHEMSFFYILEIHS